MPYSRHGRPTRLTGSPTGLSASSLRYWAAALAGILVALLIVFGVLVAVAHAADGSVSIPDQVFRGAPGDLFAAGTIPATAGDQCATTLTYTNNSPDPSDHPDTDILVGPVTFTDVEHGAFVSAGLTFTATGPVDVALRLGSDGVSSGGYLVEVTCNPPTTTTTISPTTTVPPPTTETTVPSVTTTTLIPPVTPTTLSPPPVGGVATGGGACSDGSCDDMPWPAVAAAGAGFALLAVATVREWLDHRGPQ